MSDLGILALDIATSTGWALRGRDGSVASGVQRFDLGRGESPGMRFLRFRRWLKEIVQPEFHCSLDACNNEKHRAVDVIAYERAHHRGGAATAVCVGMATVMLEEAARLGIEVSPVATKTLKKHATGKGNAGKPEMIAAARKRWVVELGQRRSPITDPLGDDEADALCCLAWAMDSLGVATAPSKEKTP